MITLLFGGLTSCKTNNFKARRDSFKNSYEKAFQKSNKEPVNVTLSYSGNSIILNYNFSITLDNYEYDGYAENIFNKFQSLSKTIDYSIKDRLNIVSVKVIILDKYGKVIDAYENQLDAIGQTAQKYTDTVTVVPFIKEEGIDYKIDKYHAFDDIYFGKEEENYGRLIENTKYKLIQSTNNAELIYYFEFRSMVPNFSKKETLDKINTLKKSISKKYSQPQYLNKTVRFHYDKELKLCSNFGPNTFITYNYVMDKKYDGKIVERALYYWDTKFKTIQIGYWIIYPAWVGPQHIYGSYDKYIRKFRENQDLEKHGYGRLIYIQIISKLITPSTYTSKKKQKKENNDWEKF